MSYEPFLYPLLAALVMAMLAWLLGGRRGNVRVTWAAAAAWGLAFVAAYYGLKGDFAPFQPRESMHWLFWAVVLAIPLGSLHGWKFSVPHFLLGSVLLMSFVWLASAPLRKHEWNEVDAFQIPMLVGAIGSVALVLQSDLMRARPTGIQVPGAMALTFGGAAFVFGQSMGGAAHLAGGMALAGLVWALYALARPKAPVSHGSALPYITTLFGLLFVGVFFSETPKTAAILLLAAPQGLRFGWPFLNEKVGFVVSLLFTAALVGTACYFGLPPEDTGDPYGEYR